ncbi:hypothetical protein CAEBREN_09011 [Caenorhabditis brenneri]|uniref:BTB domain-containing protein n=1 Tax=Caenorhabditis brenneri TaxID=135651 RepID=G0MD93_CAEBE|nr:hypothetical protein CAEBREN_09011 [Caenorhabditis brenneri]
MSTKLSRKRAVNMPDEILPKKTVPEVLEASDSINYDVTIIVDGQRFQCLKKELSHHSMYFQRMFNSNFNEKDKKEVELGGMVKSEAFDMFLKVVLGEGVVTDVTVEKLLELADYLESATLEANCIHHLGQKTGFSLAHQFEMAETYHSNKLMIQVCASIKDAYELDEVIPKDLDSFCNTTKNIVMQRTFELLGIRKPAQPPLPDLPDEVFELRMNQLIDQAEVQNHHGEILEDQVQLLWIHLFTKFHSCYKDETAKQIGRDDPLIKELSNQLRQAHEQGERNFIQAQIQVLELKHIYTRVKNEELGLEPNYRTYLMEDIPIRLHHLSAVLNRHKRSRSRSQIDMLGNREIDEVYRRITTMERNQAKQRPRNMYENPTWLQNINRLNCVLKIFLRNCQNRMQRPMPDGIRHVSNRASFRAITEFVVNTRYIHYQN